MTLTVLTETRCHQTTQTQTQILNWQSYGMDLNIMIICVTQMPSVKLIIHQGNIQVNTGSIFVRQSETKQ